MMALLLASVLVLTNRFGSVSVDTYGARVLSYVPTGGSEVFAMLSSGYGGVPLCWPWFQYNGPQGKDSPKHGLARYREFTVVGRENGTDAGKIVLRLESDAETQRIWPYEFSLTVIACLDSRGLALDMTAKNTGKRSFSETAAFHPYLLRSEASRFAETGSGYFRTWDPGPDSHLKTEGLAPDDWKRFICVENGLFDGKHPFVLAPGCSHTVTRVFARSLESGSSYHDNNKGEFL